MIAHSRELDEMNRMNLKSTNLEDFEQCYDNARNQEPLEYGEKYST